MPSEEDWKAEEEVVSDLYLSSNITPYMHALVYYTADIMRIYKN